MEYAEGSIVKIKIENVLTYDSVEFTCGSRLNVIIGPNGSGKSTIVCAICLGLAGKTSWLGRAHSPVDYIKYGKNKARIDIELHNNDGDNWIISREFNRQGHGPLTKWWVNGRPATQKVVEELVGRLKIQVGNLTQFLPQEKVNDFAKMSDTELLENTEKAIGDTDLFEKHQQLKDSRSNAVTLEQEYSNLQALLNQEQQKNARIEQDVKNFEERKVFLLKIEKHEQKKAWVKYETKRLEYKALRKDKDKADEELKRVRAMYAPMENELSEAKKESDTLSALIKNKTGELNQSAKSAEANGKDIDSLTDKYVEIQEEFKVKKEEEEARKKRLRDLNKQLALLEEELKNTKDVEDVQPQLDAMNKSLRDVTQKIGQVTEQGDECRLQIAHHKRNLNGIQHELTVLRNIENLRLQTLRAKHKDTYDAVLWLRENQHQFQSTIHEPPMLCVNMKNPTMAKYLEGHISFNDMRAFVCETSEDMNKFMDIMKDEQKLRVNAVKTNIHLPPEQCQPRFPIQRYRKYGFHSYLMDLFTCPDAVMKFLCIQYKVHSIPVGDNKTKDNVDKIVKEHPELNCFYTTNNQYNIKKSRYSNTTSSRSTVLKDASLLTVSMDTQKEKELVQQLHNENEAVGQREEKYKQLQQMSHDLNQQLGQCREEMRKLRARKDVKKKLQSQIVTKKQSIKNVESSALDITAEEEKIKKKYKDITDKKLRYLKQYEETTKVGPL
ncbi:Structural maintenance of chromosomes protein 5 [Mactra antiquata]